MLIVEGSIRAGACSSLQQSTSGCIPYSEPEYAVGFFRKHLPPGISAAADWDGLQVIPGSFVKSRLSQVHSDLLFSLEIGERRCLLYLLLEHQSKVDPTMPLRLLGNAPRRPAR